MSLAHERVPGPAAFQRRGRIRPGDAVLYVVTCAAALSGVVLLALITREVLADAWPAMQKFGLHFLTTQAWGDHNKTLFGSELAPRWIRALVAPLVELLAAIPSVVLGLWGILVLGPFVKGTLGPALHGTLGWLPLFATKPTYASNLFVAILILTIMIVPIVSSICRELFTGVPQELKDGALALGSTRWEMTRGVVFPYARAGIAAALILGLGRAVGEAIAVTQVIGSNVAIHWDLFKPGDTLASRIAGQYQGADTALQVASLVYLAVILLVFSLIANLAAQLIVRRVAGRHQIR